MKIQINYDLIEKITEAKVGFSLKRTSKKILSNTCIVSAIVAPIQTTNMDLFVSIFENFAFQAIWMSSASLALANACKKLSISELKTLSQKLSDINVNTDYQLLQNSYQYKTNYKLEFNKYYLPYIKQDKYIMVPVYKDGDVDEVSLLQEHVVGTDEYSLSHGSYTKILKYSYNPI